MSKKGQKKKIRLFNCNNVKADRKAQEEAADFLARIEGMRRAYKADDIPLTRLQQQLEEQIEQAFAGVSCQETAHVLLCGEAADDYVSQEAREVLATKEIRDDWHRIPDDLLSACSFSLCYADAVAYRFLVPRFMIGALHGVVECYPGISPKNERLAEYERQQMQLLTPAQQQCISDFLSLDNVNEQDNTYYGRNQFTPMELDEYHARYEQEMTLREYGAMLMKRYAERVGIGQ